MCNDILSYVMQWPSKYTQVQFIIKATRFPFSCIKQIFLNQSLLLHADRNWVGIRIYLSEASFQNPKKLFVI